MYKDTKVYINQIIKKKLSTDLFIHLSIFIFIYIKMDRVQYTHLKKLIKSGIIHKS